MSRFVVMPTVNDPKLKSDAKFDFKIIDNSNYVINDQGVVSAIKGYKPEVGDKFTVEVSYTCSDGYVSKNQKTYTVKI